MPVHIPWDQVILHGPKVLDAATLLWDKLNSRPRPQAIDPDAEIKTQLAGIVQRLQALEDAQAASVELDKAMAEQLQGLSAGLSELSRKTAIALWTACGAMLVSVIVLAVVVLR